MPVLELDTVGIHVLVVVVVLLKLNTKPISLKKDAMLVGGKDLRA